MNGNENVHDTVKRIEDYLAVKGCMAFPIVFKVDHNGVATGWCRLNMGADLLHLAEVLAEIKARLLTMTAYLPDKGRGRDAREIAYHFDVYGIVVTVTLELPFENASVPSLTPIFRNAAWNEREFMELYRIQVTDHPDPRPLFLDKSIGPGVLDRLVPYSTMVNGAGTKTLWEKILSKSTGEAI